MLDYVFFAYIDPVSGFILLQMIISGAIGSAVYFRNKIGRGMRLLLGRSRKDA